MSGLHNSHEPTLRRIASTIILTLGVCAATPAPAALAAGLHAFAGDITGSGTDALSRPVSVAVDSSGDASARDVYVVDEALRRVEKFSPGGGFLLTFGKDVNETTGGDVCSAGSGDVCKAGISSPSPGGFVSPRFAAVDSSTSSSAGDVYVADLGDNKVSKFSPSGALITSWGVGGQMEFLEIQGITTDSAGNLFVLDNDAHSFASDGTPGAVTKLQYNEGTSPVGFAVDSEGNSYRYRLGDYLEKMSDNGTRLGIHRYGEDVGGFAVDAHNKLYAVIGEPGEETENGYIRDYEPTCPFEQFEVPCEAIETFGVGHLSWKPGGLSIDSFNGTVYVADPINHRVAIFENELPLVFTESPSSATETSATFTGHVDPSGHGTVESCQFEYGPTTAYATGTVPCSPATPYSSSTGVTAEVSGLQPGATYHYRLVASNAIGQNSGVDHTVRTEAPPSIDGVRASHVAATSADIEVTINPNGLDTTYFVEYGFTDNYGSTAPAQPVDIGSGEVDQESTIHLTGLENGKLYHFRVVAKNSLGTEDSEGQSFNFYPPSCPNSTVRQQTGAEFLPDCRAYELVVPPVMGNATIVIPGNSPAGPQATSPPRIGYATILGNIEGTKPPNTNASQYVATRTANGWVTRYVGRLASETLQQSTLFGDLSFDKFIDFTSSWTGDVNEPTEMLPFAWNAEGGSLGRWPIGATQTIPHADETLGAFQPSPDFSHLAFSSRNVSFAPGGLTTGIGSAYDYETATHTTTVISLLPSDEPIPQQATNQADQDEFIIFPPVRQRHLPAQNYPGVSTNGSHILMSTSPRPTACTVERGCIQTASTLYMRVNDAVTYEVSKGHNVRYVGMTADGKKVYFTSGERLTGEDTDNSTDLYMWSEATNSLTLISKGSSGSGNGNSCNVEWTEGCNAVPAIGADYTDNNVAEESGDVYFYSPEKLDGSKGITGDENLYVYRDGAVHFVAALTPATECVAVGGLESACANGAVARIQISREGRYMAFLTASKVTGYENAGYQEMYRYDAATERIICVSCDPSGDPPTANVLGSEDGIFMANDGRTFFYSAAPLAARDTDNEGDVYEYTEGRPQLITSGTAPIGSVNKNNERIFTAGLIGTTVDGANVYFSTYDTLAGQDENGQFLKIYDARTNGGFLFTPASESCDSGDECHGQRSSAPPAIANGSGGALPGGNASAASGKKPHRTPRHRRRHRHPRSHAKHQRSDGRRGAR